MIVQCRATVVSDSPEAMDVARTLYDAVSSILERNGTNIRINKEVNQVPSGGMVYTISYGNSSYVTSFDLSWTEEV